VVVVAVVEPTEVALVLTAAAAEAEVKGPADGEVGVEVAKGEAGAEFPLFDTGVSVKGLMGTGGNCLLDGEGGSFLVGEGGPDDVAEGIAGATVVVDGRVD